MQRNNKGFSLIELVVIMALMAIAGVAIIGFVWNTSNSYRRTNTDIRLQYEQQQAVNRLRDLILESDQGIYFDESGKTLVLYSARNEEGKYPVTAIFYDPAEQKLYSGNMLFADAKDISFDQITERNLMAENVEEFNVDLRKVKKDEVIFHITFMVGNNRQSVMENVALRNRLVVSNEANTIWDDVPQLVESFIKGIVIYRGDKKMEAGSLDTIGKMASDDVSVAYTAKVEANEESTREYAVTWNVLAAGGTDISGIHVTEDGLVTVPHMVDKETEFTLTATSVDDPTKSASIQIKVTLDGVYPKTAELTVSESRKGNGYLSYFLEAVLTYTDEKKTVTSVERPELFSWIGVDKLSGGCSFDPMTGELILTSVANGRHFTISAKATERASSGEVIQTTPVTIIVQPEEIPEYKPGEQSVRIAVSPSLSRGGYIVPTMIFSNAKHSSYTYDWKIAEYQDGTSDEWGKGANSTFDRVSLNSFGGYDNNQVYHEISASGTDGAHARSIVLNCAEYLNWTGTYKLKISGTATDKTDPEKKLYAPEKIITIDPVSFSITLTDDPKNRLKNDKDRPIIADPLLQYEDWQWESDPVKKKKTNTVTTRRRFTLEASNLVMDGDSRFTYTHNYLFKDAGGNVTPMDMVNLPTEESEDLLQVRGFSACLYNWEKMSILPTNMNFNITMKDLHGNSIDSNVLKFGMKYDFFEMPKEETDSGIGEM